MTFAGARLTDPLGTRMTVIERDLMHMGNRIDEHLRDSKETHDRLGELLERMDRRADGQDERAAAALLATERRFFRLDVRLAGIAGAVGLAVFMAQLFAPLIQQFLRLPTGP